MKVWEITGAELDQLLDTIDYARSQPFGIYKMSFADDGGAKVKINEYTWSPPMGTVKA